MEKGDNLEIIEDFNKNVPNCFELNEAQRILKVALMHENKDKDPSVHKHGGFLSLGSRASGKFACTPIYEIGKEPVLKYSYYALEKVMRIFKNGDVRSMLSRNKELEQFGGGIGMGGLLTGFSALFEERDEAYSVAYASYKSAKNFFAHARVTEEVLYAVVHQKMMNFMHHYCPDNEWIKVFADDLYLIK